MLQHNVLTSIGIFFSIQRLILDASNSRLSNFEPEENTPPPKSTHTDPYTPTKSRAKSKLL